MGRQQSRYTGRDRNWKGWTFQKHVLGAGAEETRPHPDPTRGPGCVPKILPRVINVPRTPESLRRRPTQAPPNGRGLDSDRPAKTTPPARPSPEALRPVSAWLRPTAVLAPMTVAVSLPLPEVLLRISAPTRPPNSGRRSDQYALPRRCQRRSTQNLPQPRPEAVSILARPHFASRPLPEALLTGPSPVPSSHLHARATVRRPGSG